MDTKKGEQKSRLKTVDKTCYFIMEKCKLIAYYATYYCAPLVCQRAHHRTDLRPAHDLGFHFQTMYNAMFTVLDVKSAHNFQVMMTWAVRASSKVR